jgi:hypothetical protein
MRLLLVGVMLAALFLVIGCEGDDGDTGDAGAPGAPGAPGFTTPLSVYVSNNGTTNAGDVDQVNESFQFLKRFVAGNNEGVILDVLGNLFQAGDLNAPADPGSIRVISKIRHTADGETFDRSFDRILGGGGSTMTGLTNPKGINIADRAGFLLIANNSAMQVAVFGTAAGGDVPPVATTPIAAAPWDLVYDEAADRLFVAVTNGTVEVFDNYIGGDFGQGGADRTFTPSDADGDQISVNLHGIAYDAQSDRLVVSDVGAGTAMQSADFATDGQIFVFSSASTLDGAVQPDRTIAGANTLLGNPVDLILNGADIRVAEKANDFLLVFRNIFSGAGGNIAPDLAVADTKPESLVSEAADPADFIDVTDIDDPSIAISAVATASNPAAPGPTTGQVARLTTGLGATVATFDTDRSLENITFDAAGDAYITFDDGANLNGGIAIVNRLATSRNDETFTASRDRQIRGADTTLVSPKGIEVVDSLGLVLVAENDATASAIVAFGMQARGNIAPVFRVTDLNNGRPWDLDYDPPTDRLFVAMTNGQVLVFDAFSTARGAGGPDRVITPTGSVNLHGIIYVSDADTLLLSDVGDAASNADGQIFVIQGASIADGNTAPNASIAGVATTLGNPVDVTFDGAHLYVAEKANNMLLRFDNILLTPGGNVAPTVAGPSTAPESVALAPAFLAGTP